MSRVTWEGSLHQSWRLLPVDARSRSLEIFLESEGLSKDEVLALLPYDTERAASPGSQPDARRYRDAKQVYQTTGLLYEDSDGRIVVTDLGRAVRRWLDRITPENAPVLGRHAATALSACQLRHPSRAGADYDNSMVVFPYAFIWRAMLKLDNRITSDELNRALFRVRDASELEVCIATIRDARASGRVTDLGDETITGSRKNDRVIPWVAVASFGWTLIADKRDDPDQTWYRVRPNCVGVLREAARIQHAHRDFDSMPAYVQHLSRVAAVPPDLR